MINDEKAATLLNRLLRAEHCTLLHRLKEAAPHISWLSTDEADRIEEMILAAKGHMYALAEAVFSLHVPPDAGPPGLATASSHYCGLEYLLPQVVAEKERLVGEYEAVIRTLGGHRCVGVLTTILAAHREHVAELRGWLASARAVARSPEPVSSSTAAPSAPTAGGAQA